MLLFITEVECADEEVLLQLRTSTFRYRRGPRCVVKSLNFPLHPYPGPQVVARDSARLQAGALDFLSRSQPDTTCLLCVCNCLEMQRSFGCLLPMADG